MWNDSQILRPNYQASDRVSGILVGIDSGGKGAGVIDGNILSFICTFLARFMVIFFSQYDREWGFENQNRGARNRS